jgi:hypothetical protein
VYVVVEVLIFKYIGAVVRSSVDDHENRVVNTPLSIEEQKLDSHVPNTPSFSFSELGFDRVVRSHL